MTAAVATVYPAFLRGSVQKQFFIQTGQFTLSWFRGGRLVYIWYNIGHVE